MNFAAVDLNLLRVFDAMMLELNTVRAGERLGLSQPAVSSALGRLRHIAGDQLFLREGNRMVPTARAEALSEPIRSALRQLEAVLGSTMAFDPSTAERKFRIIGSDYFSSLLMPPLVRGLVGDAPGIVVQMLDRPTASITALLSDDAADLAMDARIETPDWISKKVLWRSRMTTVARADDPRLRATSVRSGERIPPALFCEFGHALMSMDGGMIGSIDRELARRGLRRLVVATVPHFHAVAQLVAEAGVLGNLPEHFARRVAPQLGLSIYLPPFDPPGLDVMLYWHARRDSDVALAWLRERIVKVMTLGSDEPTAKVHKSAAVSRRTELCAPRRATAEQHDV